MKRVKADSRGDKYNISDKINVLSLLVELTSYFYVRNYVTCDMMLIEDRFLSLPSLTPFVFSILCLSQFDQAHHTTKVARKLSIAQ